MFLKVGSASQLHQNDLAPPPSHWSIISWAWGLGVYKFIHSLSDHKHHTFQVSELTLSLLVCTHPDVWGSMRRPSSSLTPSASFSGKLRQAGAGSIPTMWPACNICYSDFNYRRWMLQWQKQERNPCGRGSEYRRTACHFANSMSGGQKEAQ